MGSVQAQGALGLFFLRLQRPDPVFSLEDFSMFDEQAPQGNRQKY